MFQIIKIKTKKEQKQKQKQKEIIREHINHCKIWCDLYILWNWERNAGNMECDVIDVI